MPEQYDIEELLDFFGAEYPDETPEEWVSWPEYIGYEFRNTDEELEEWITELLMEDESDESN